MKAGLNRIDKTLWRLVDAVILVAVIGMVCLITLQVSSRFIGASIPWTEELSRFLFIWTIWLGLAAGFRNGQHPAVTLLPDLLPASARRGLRVLSALASVTLFAAVTSYGWTLMLQQLRFGEQSAILQIGMWLTTLPLVLGAGLAILGTIIEAISPAADDGATLSTDPNGAQS